MKSPLAINVFWHTAAAEAHEYAELLYSFFYRNPKDPLDRYLGVPVNLFPFVPAAIDQDRDEVVRTVSIILIEDHLNLDPEWNEFLSSLRTETDHLVLPIALNTAALQLGEKLSRQSFLRLYKIDPWRKAAFLLITLAHQICRRLYQPEQDGGLSGLAAGPPIKLFLSHAKKDGEKMAKELHTHINQFTDLDTFFDSRDLAGGFPFDDGLRRELKESVLIAIHTDTYSSREWCRRELLGAKKNNCPLIVLNQYSKGELRSFPYIGNVPHIHYEKPVESENDNRALLDYIVLAAIRETLRFKYNLLKASQMAEYTRVKVGAVLSYPPELVSLVYLKEVRNSLVIYPDPPLGQEEQELLESFRPDLEFLTPTLLALVNPEDGTYRELDGIRIGFSLSETDQTLYPWIQNRAIQDLMVEIARYLLIAGADLIYSGSLNYGQEPGEKEEFNFSRLLIDLMRTYRYEYGQAVQKTISPVNNYLFYPVSHFLSLTDESNLKELVTFIRIPPPANLGAGETTAASILRYDTFDKKYVWAKSLTAMRHAAARAEQARISLGGKWLGFRGIMPGVLEETLLSLQQGGPVYLIGAFGGVTAGIIEALRGGSPTRMDDAFYVENDPSYAHFQKKYNQHALTGEEERVDYRDIVDFLRQTGRSDSAYGLNNGLSREENERLFHSRNPVELTGILLKGLQTLTKL